MDAAESSFWQSGKNVGHTHKGQTLVQSFVIDEKKPTVLFFFAGTLWLFGVSIFEPTVICKLLMMLFKFLRWKDFKFFVQLWKLSAVSLPWELWRMVWIQVVVILHANVFQNLDITVQFSRLAATHKKTTGKGKRDDLHFSLYFRPDPSPCEMPPFFSSCDMRKKYTHRGQELFPWDARRDWNKARKSLKKYLVKYKSRHFQLFWLSNSIVAILELSTLLLCKCHDLDEYLAQVNSARAQN